jgi:hypothetical protein
MTLTSSTYVYPKNCGFSRGVALTSAGNNSGVTFTITGIIYSYSTGFSVVSESLTGPNANTVNSANYYTQINSIVASGAFTNVAATVSDSGDALVLLDYLRKVFDVAVTVDLPRVGGLTIVDPYATTQIINFPTSRGLVFDFNPSYTTSLQSSGSNTGESLTIPTFTGPITGLRTFKYFTPCTALYFKFGNATGTAGTYTGACPITVIQQGLTS